jgi:hypothetical protein
VHPVAKVIPLLFAPDKIVVELSSVGLRRSSGETYLDRDVRLSGMLFCDAQRSTE